METSGWSGKGGQHEEGRGVFIASIKLEFGQFFRKLRPKCNLSRVPDDWHPAARPPGRRAPGTGQNLRSSRAGVCCGGRRRTAAAV